MKQQETNQRNSLQNCQLASLDPGVCKTLERPKGSLHPLFISPWGMLFRERKKCFMCDLQMEEGIFYAVTNKTSGIVSVLKLHQMDQTKEVKRLDNYVLVYSKEKGIFL